MMINVESVDRMIDDICEMLDIVPEYLMEQLLKISESASEADDYCGAFLGLSELFIQEHTSEKIENIYFCHLTRSIDKPSGILPIQALLTTENSFSLFLKEYSLRFFLEDEQLVMEYQGKRISPLKLYDPDRFENKHVRLAGRLGYIGVKDYCVNGFVHAIDPEKSTDGYYRLLMHGPEILQDLDEFLHTNMCMEYIKRSKFYYAVSKVPLSNVIFDQRQDFNVEGDRTKIYLSICFEFLLSWYTKTRWTSILHNEMIRMNDYETIVIDHYIELPCS